MNRFLLFHAMPCQAVWIDEEERKILRMKFTILIWLGCVRR